MATYLRVSTANKWWPLCHVTWHAGQRQRRYPAAEQRSAAFRLIDCSVSASEKHLTDEVDNIGQLRRWAHCDVVAWSCLSLSEVIIRVGEETFGGIPTRRSWREVY